MEKKITVQCCVPSCKNTNHMNPHILFFPFPKRREMQEKWLSAIRRPELKNILPVDKPFHMFICLDHFKQEDVVQLNKRTCLRAGVIPSVFKCCPLDVKIKDIPSLPNLLPKHKPEAVDEHIISIHCGSLEAELHLEKFYCPGIHRECIKYNNQFITPKMFMIMGDKERLKDWKNAIRIGGVKIRKFIESKQIDFCRHKEFCTGRCVARLPVNLFRTRSQPPDEYINTSGDITNIKFASGDKRPEVSRSIASGSQPVIETEFEEDDDSDDSIVDEKPNLETLNALLKTPIPATMITKEPSAKLGITDNQIFWKGVAQLGLIDSCFQIIKGSITQLEANCLPDSIQPEDAHLLSSLVREMGLSNKIQHMLASSKQDMDNHYNKLDEEMQELQQKVYLYENRKRMLKKRSEEFQTVLNMNNPKNLIPDCGEPNTTSFQLPNKRPTEENLDTNVKRLKITSNSENLMRILQSPQSSYLPVPPTPTSTFVMAKDIIKPGHLLKIIPNERGGEPFIIQRQIGIAEDSLASVENSGDAMPKIVSVESIKPEVKLTRNENDDMTTVEDIQNVVANGQQLTEKILQSTRKTDDDENVDIDDDDDEDLLETLETYGEGQDSQMRVIPDPENPKVKTVLWVRSDGVSEVIRFSNNSECSQSMDDNQPTDTAKRLSKNISDINTETFWQSNSSPESPVKSDNLEQCKTDNSLVKRTHHAITNEEMGITLLESSTKDHAEIQEPSQLVDNAVEISNADKSDNISNGFEKDACENVSIFDDSSSEANSQQVDNNAFADQNELTGRLKGRDSLSSVPDESRFDTMATRRSSRRRVVKVKEDL